MTTPYCDFQLRKHEGAVRWGLKALSLEPENLPALIAVASAEGASDHAPVWIVLGQ